MTDEEPTKRGRKPKSREEQALPDIRGGMSVEDIAAKHGVSYGTALWWRKKQAEMPAPAARSVEVPGRSEPVVRESGRY